MVQQVDIDLDACLGCGACVALCPEVFVMNETLGKAQPVRSDGDKRAVAEAAAACPTRCISWA